MADEIANDVGDLIEDQLPPFIQPAKDLIQYATDLMGRIKSDFMDFYNVSTCTSYIFGNFIRFTVSFSSLVYSPWCFMCW